MKSVLSLFGVIALFGIGLPVQGSEDSFPCTKLAEILPDAALTFAQEYFAWKNPDKINVWSEILDINMMDHANSQLLSLYKTLPT